MIDAGVNHMKPLTCHHPKPNQRGAVLFVALVFLVLLTLLALTASSTSIMQEKMTGGTRNLQLGLMGAESALRGGETHLWNLAYDATSALPMPPCASNSTVGCVHQVKAGLLDSSVQTFRTSSGWLTSDGALAYEGGVTDLEGDMKTASLASQPLYLIEDLGPDVPAGQGRRGGSIQQEKAGIAGSMNWYRITARSQGGSEAVVRVAESVFSATAPSTYNPGTPEAPPTP